jgi:hypothetical protein
MSGPETLIGSTRAMTTDSPAWKSLSEPLPARFFGAWARDELVVDDDLVADAGRAVWVQAGCFFVDVRGPGGFAGDTCFAGSTKWVEPYLEWEHAVDLERGHEGSDRGRITFDGDDLIEEGGFIAGEHRPYRERWRRLPGPAAPLLAAVAKGAVAVRIGAHAAVVVDDRAQEGGFSARYLRNGSAGWVAELTIECGPAVIVPRPLEPGIALPPGWRWMQEQEIGDQCLT